MTFEPATDVIHQAIEKPQNKITFKSFVNKCPGDPGVLPTVPLAQVIELLVSLIIKVRCRHYLNGAVLENLSYIKYLFLNW